MLCLSDGINIGRILAAEVYRDRYFPDHSSMTISVVAHIGGAVSGLLAGLLLYTASAGIGASAICAIWTSALRIGTFVGVVIVVILILHLES